VNLHRAQDECGIGSGHTQLAQLRRQRLLNRQKQRRRPVAFVRDRKQVLSVNQRPALRTGK
jgi:hypothetical protein